MLDAGELATWKAELSDAGEDAVEHYARSPEVAEAETFDHEDDSLYNDQNDPGWNRAFCWKTRRSRITRRTG